LLLLLASHQGMLLALRQLPLTLLVTTRLEALVALRRLLLLLLRRTMQREALLALRHPSLLLLLLAPQLATRASNSMASPACNQLTVTGCGSACACQPGHRRASLEVRQHPGYAAPSLRTHWEHPAPSLPWWRCLQLSPGGQS
jgi:hypothetical protein